MIVTFGEMGSSILYFYFLFIHGSEIYNNQLKSSMNIFPETKQRADQHPNVYLTYQLLIGEKGLTKSTN